MRDSSGQNFWTKDGRRVALTGLLKKFRDTGTVDRRQGSDRPWSARTNENIDQVNDTVLSQEGLSQTHNTVREISRKTGIPKSSVVRIIRKDVQLKCFKRRRAQELTEANYTACELLLKKFSQFAAELIFFIDEKVFTVASAMKELWKSVKI